MRREGIQSKVAKKFVITTDSRNTSRAAPDRLKRCFDTGAQNQAWVSDTTFIPTREGWLYLAVVLDLFSRQAIGWAMGNQNDSALVENALIMAIWRRGKPRDVIVHSDQGSTYASAAYQQRLKENSLVCSMSRKGECLDNAVAESFFGTLKRSVLTMKTIDRNKKRNKTCLNTLKYFITSEDDILTWAISARRNMSRGMPLN
jgi:transposase InsO family protein